MVVGDRAALGEHLAGGKIHPGHSRHAESEISLPAEDRPHRIGDIRGGDPGGGHLVEQRLEEVIVVLIDQDHLHRGAGQLAGGAQPGKAGPDDDDPGKR